MRRSHVVGDVFADLGPHDLQRHWQDGTGAEDGAIIERRGLTQAAAAEVLQIYQPKVSALPADG